MNHSPSVSVQWTCTVPRSGFFLFTPHGKVEMKSSSIESEATSGSIGSGGSCVAAFCMSHRCTAASCTWWRRMKPTV
jgi:hypothetical protein